MASLCALCVLCGSFLGCTSEIRYHYPRQSGELDLALDRLERTIEVARDEGGAAPPQEAALEVIRTLRRVLDRRRLDAARVEPALELGAARLEEAADDARALIGPGLASGARDRLFDLARQSRRAAFEARALRRTIAAAPGGA